MNTVSMETTPMGSPRVDPEVTAYVGLVRLALQDLPVEDVEELTGGLEADLGELAAESEESLLSRLGEPSAYAAELRAAAGLPPAATVSAVATASRPSLAQRSARVGDWWRGVLAERPWLAELRPLWWALRGLVAWGAVSAVLGMSSWLVGLLLVAGSVWVGLSTPGRGSSVRRLVRIGNAVAAVLLVPSLLVLAVGSAGAYVDDGGYVETVPPEGVVVDGEQVGSFYVYDGQGRRVDGARIFTDTGRPVTIDPWMLPSMDGVVEDDGPIDSFPVEREGLEGWRGNTLEPGGWTPPVLIGPAPGMDAEPESSSEPSPSGGPEVPAAEPSGDPTETTPTP